MSINAIVMLVMAMALLGLGLTFIRGMMGGATDKLGGAVDSADLSQPATPQKPIVVDPKTIKIKRGESGTLKIGYYNDGSTEKTVTLGSDFKCQKGGEESLTAASEATTISSLGNTVQAGQSGAFEAIIDVPEGDSGNHVCAVSLEADSKLGKASFFIQVTG